MRRELFLDMLSEISTRAVRESARCAYKAGWARGVRNARLSQQVRRKESVHVHASLRELNHLLRGPLRHRLVQTPWVAASCKTSGLPLSEGEPSVKDLPELHASRRLSSEHEKRGAITKEAMTDRDTSVTPTRCPSQLRPNCVGSADGTPADGEGATAMNKAVAESELSFVAVQTSSDAKQGGCSHLMDHTSLSTLENDSLNVQPRRGVSLPTHQGGEAMPGVRGTTSLDSTSTFHEDCTGSTRAAQSEDGRLTRPPEDVHRRSLYNNDEEPHRAALEARVSAPTDTIKLIETTKRELWARLEVLCNAAFHDGNDGAEAVRHHLQRMDKKVELEILRKKQRLYERAKLNTATYPQAATEVSHGEIMSDNLVNHDCADTSPTSETQIVSQKSDSIERDTFQHDAVQPDIRPTERDLLQTATLDGAVCEASSDNSTSDALNLCGDRATDLSRPRTSAHEAEKCNASAAELNGPQSNDVSSGLSTTERRMGQQEEPTLLQFQPKRRSHRKPSHRRSSRNSAKLPSPFESSLVAEEAQQRKSASALFSSKNVLKPKQPYPRTRYGRYRVLEDTSVRDRSASPRHRQTNSTRLQSSREDDCSANCIATSPAASGSTTPRAKDKSTLSDSTAVLSELLPDRPTSTQEHANEAPITPSTESSVSENNSQLCRDSALHGRNTSAKVHVAFGKSRAPPCEEDDPKSKDEMDNNARGRGRDSYDAVPTTPDKRWEQLSRILTNARPHVNSRDHTFIGKAASLARKMPKKKHNEVRPHFVRSERAVKEYLHLSSTFRSKPPSSSDMATAYQTLRTGGPKELRLMVQRQRSQITTTTAGSGRKAYRNGHKSHRKGPWRGRHR